MGQVNVFINDRSYTVACGDGEEEHLRELARYLDAHVGELAKTVGQVGDARLLLMAGLVIADELAEARDSLEELQREVAVQREARSAVQDQREESDTRIAELLTSASKRIEDMAVRLEQSAL